MERVDPRSFSGDRYGGKLDNTDCSRAGELTLHGATNTGEVPPAGVVNVDGNVLKANLNSKC
jgi:hypothetical protein